MDRVEKESARGGVGEGGEGGGGGGLVGEDTRNHGMQRGMSKGGSLA